MNMQDEYRVKERAWAQHEQAKEAMFANQAVSGGGLLGGAGYKQLGSDGPPERPKEIPRVLDSLEIALSRLENLIGRARERLTPILGQDFPTEAGKAGNAVADTFCPIGQCLKSFETRIQNMTEVLTNVSDRLQLP